jgi:putative flippase GtrA
MIESIKKLFYKYRILNFMLVGGIGYIINMAVYYPLMLVFKNEVTILNTHFYLPPFLISTYIAATSNYLLNKRWTFNDKDRQKQSYIRYLVACAFTVCLDIVLLFILVDYGHLKPELAVALALLVMFILRYIVVKKWVWKEKK